jgi:serine protease Do
MILDFYNLTRRSCLVLVLCLLVSGFGTPPVQASSSEGHADSLSDFNGLLSNLVQQVSPAVVQIQVTRYALTENQGRNISSISTVEKERDVGSGFIIDSDGYIITNAHVVKNALRIRILLTGKIGKSEVSDSLEGTDRLPEEDARLVGMDPAFDVALLKIDATGLPKLSFADYTKLTKGQVVLAFGNPEGFENSVTMGIVSAVARQVLANVPAVYIQTDAPINHGNSGGPLVNTEGQVIGVNTFLLSESGGSQGLGFAIPSSIVRQVYEELRKEGYVHHSVIGVELQDITAELAEDLNLSREEGVIVADVEPNGPADTGGLQIQDILLSLNGREIGSVSFAEMMITTSPVDSVLEAEILRGTEKITVRIPVRQQETDNSLLSNFDPGKALVRKMGVFGVEVDERIPGLRRPSGVMIAGLTANSESARTGLQVGDVIHALNGHAIDTLKTLRSVLDDIPSGGSGVLQVERDGKLKYLIIETI